MKLYCNGDWVFWKKDERGHYQVIKKINVTGGNAHWFREEEINMIMQDDGNLVVYYQKKSDCNEKYNPECMLLRKISRPSQAVWSSGTSGSFNNGTGRLEYQADGNLVIYSLK